MCYGKDEKTLYIKYKDRFKILNNVLKVIIVFKRDIIYTLYIQDIIYNIYKTLYTPLFMIRCGS